jgi:hypothetical protein
MDNKYYVVSKHKDDEFNEGCYGTLEEAIDAARTEWIHMAKSDKKTTTIEVRQYEHDIEAEDCENFDYNYFEWRVCIPELSEEEIEAVKKLYNYLDKEAWDAEEDYRDDYLTVNKARNGREVVWYLDNERSEALYVDRLEWLDEDEIKEELE